LRTCSFTLHKMTTEEKRDVSTQRCLFSLLLFEHENVRSFALEDGKDCGKPLPTRFGVCASEPMVTEALCFLMASMSCEQVVVPAVVDLRPLRIIGIYLNTNVVLPGKRHSIRYYLPSAPAALPARPHSARQNRYGRRLEQFRLTPDRTAEICLAIPAAGRLYIFRDMAPAKTGRQWIDPSRIERVMRADGLGNLLCALDIVHFEARCARLSVFVRFFQVEQFGEIPGNVAFPHPQSQYRLR